MLLGTKIDRKLRFLIQRMANRMGYSIQRITRQKDEYMPCIPYNYHTYAPWYQPWFQEIYQGMRDHTLVSEDRAYTIYMLAQYALGLAGDFAECGVYKGGSAILLSKVLGGSANGSRKLHLFDSFEGMPDHADPKRDYHGPGGLGDTSYDRVKGFFSGNDRVRIYPGFIPGTFEPVSGNRFSFVHIDVDLYQSTKDCIEFFYPRLAQGGIIIDDDYGFPRYRLAAKKALDDFFSDKPEKPITLKTGQCFIIKL